MTGYLVVCGNDGVCRCYLESRLSQRCGSAILLLARDVKNAQPAPFEFDRVEEARPLVFAAAAAAAGRSAQRRDGRSHLLQRGPLPRLGARAQPPPRHALLRVDG